MTGITLSIALVLSLLEAIPINIRLHSDVTTLSISGNQILSSPGNVPFVMRGTEQIFGVLDAAGNGPFSLGGSYTALADQIILSGANTVRIQPQTDMATSDIEAIVARFTAANVVIIFNNNGASTDPNHVYSTTFIGNPVIMSILKNPTYSGRIIIEAMPELAGMSDRVTWRNAAIALINTARTTYGYTHPLLIFGPTYGRDLPGILQEGAAIVASDPLHKVIFGWEAYWGSYYESLYGMTVAEGIVAAAGAAFPIQIGLTNWAEVGCTDALDYVDNMATAAAASANWLWWDWRLPGYTCFDLSADGTFANLTSVGAAVVNGTNGIANTAAKLGTVYTILAAPSCAPAAGTYSVAQNVTCTNPNVYAATYCTLNGSTPTTSSPRCDGSNYLTVTTTGDTIRAKSFLSGYSDSATTTQAYTITPPPPQSDCDLTAPRTTGTVYYYCACGTGAASNCVAGNDANAGTSASAPRATLSGARSRFNSMNAGDTVALCRGGAWNENGGAIYNTRCTAASPCDFRDYIPAWGSQASARPRLNTTSGNVFGMGTSGHDEGYRYWNLDVRQVPGQGQAVFMFRDVSDVDICNVRFQGGTTAIEMNSTQDAGVNLARTSIRNSQFYNYTSQGIIGGTDDLLVDSNYFENVGSTGSQQRHSIYLANSGYARMTVSNNDIYEDANCGGVMLVLHQIISDVTVVNNRITSPSTDIDCFGIQSNYSVVPLAAFQNLKVLRNRVYKVSGQGIVIKGAVDGEVSDNIVVNATLDVGTGINGSVTDLTCPSNVVCTERTKVQNNSVSGSRLIVSGYDMIVENNAITGTCTYGGTLARARTGNVCGVSATAAWVNPAIYNFTPIAAGPLGGTANQTYYSATAVGTVVWSPTDAGSARSGTIDAGAMKR